MTDNAEDLKKMVTNNNNKSNDDGANDYNKDRI